MNIWNQVPLVRLLLPFVVGIISAIYFPYFTEKIIFIIVALVSIIALVVLIPKFYISYKKSWWFGIMVCVVLFLFAYQITLDKTILYKKSYFAKVISADSANYFHVQLIEPIQEKDKSVKAIVKINNAKKGNEWVAVSGKTILYFKKDSHSLTLNYGDELLIKAKMNEVLPPQNPSQFNYKQFLSFHNIYHQAYVKQNDWLYTGRNNGNYIRANSLQLRNILLNVLKQNGVAGDEYGVGAALLLGYEDKLDADIISAYSSTGAMHVLSVSGLHVGIIFIVFNWLLLFFDKIKYGNVLKAVILICLLWFYAALTGLSPSVLRAASMFSFIIVAKSFNRYTNIYNTLAASALVLLIINPYIIMEVGFQLSYLAVIGIIYIQPKIYNWISLENKLLDNIWAITTVSIAAQLATFPLGLHYFHQFPNYFLISNLLVIPISTLVIYTGVSLFVFSKIPILAKYLALGFVGLVWFLNASVKYIDKLPNALLQGISISIFETWLIYIIIILFLFYFTKRKQYYLIMSLVLLMFALSMQINEQQKEYTQKKIIVYKINKTRAIDFIDGKKNVLFTDSILASNQSSLLFNVKHNWWDLGIITTQIATQNYNNEHLKIQNNIVQFFDKTIILLNSKKNISLPKNVVPIKVDYLIISNNASLKIKDILACYNAKEIIFDSSNSVYKENKWKQECIVLNQNYYSVNDSGAKEIKL